VVSFTSTKRLTTIHRAVIKFIRDDNTMQETLLPASRFNGVRCATSYTIAVSVPGSRKLRFLDPPILERREGGRWIAVNARKPRKARR
jgi:hypothetical protein